MTPHPNAERHAARFASLPKLLVFALATLLAFSTVPTAALAEALDSSPQSEDELSWPDNVDELLDGASYVEGEALAIISADAQAAAVSLDDEDGSAQGDSSDLLANSEELFEASEASASLVLDGDEASAAALSDLGEDGGGEANGAADDEPAIQVVLVRKEGASTKALLEELAGDSRVICAEPNYTYQLEEDDGVASAVAALAGGSTGATSTGDAAAGETPTNGTSNTAANAGSTNDAAGAEGTSSASNGSTNAATTGEGSSLTNGSVTSEGETQAFSPAKSSQVSASDMPDLTKFQWSSSTDTSLLTGERGEEVDANIPNWNTSEENAGGIVCVMDTGIDYTHPDLASNMADLSGVAATIGGGANGINLTNENDGDVTNVMDKNGHGTHVAGIIAASWDGHGTSGAANGAKLMSVKVGFETGSVDLSACVKGYAYISSALDEGVDIRVINNSWGGVGSSVSINLAMTEVGRKGAVSVCASGNDGKDIDSYVLTPSGTAASPYTVVVDSTNASGLPSSFSNYGAEKTDLFSPGAMIMSTVTQTRSSYMASVVNELGANAAYDSFDGTSASDSIEAYAGFGTEAMTEENKIDGADANSGYHFDEKGSLAVTGAQLKSADQGPQGDSVHRYAVTLKIPVRKSELSKVALFGYSIVSENLWYPLVSTSLETVDDEGNVTMADGNQTVRAASGIGWSSCTIDLSQTCVGDTKLVWHQDGSDDADSGYVVVSLMLQNQGGEPTDDEKVYIDCVGLGKTTIPYALMSGTSMASPLAAGAAAICSTKVDQSLPASERALQLVSLLKSCTREDEDYEGKCTSNGVLDLSKLEDRSAAQPVINSLALEETASQNYISIEGSYLGEKTGAVTVGDYDAEVVSWGADAVKVKVPEGLTSGKREVTLTTSEGRSCRKTMVVRFATNVPEGDVPLYEESVSLEGADFADATYTTQLIGLDDYIYAFPQSKLLNSDVSTNLSFRTFWRYDTKAGTWEDMGELPAADESNSGNCYGSVSLALWEGKILMLARGVDDSMTKQALFSYDSATNSWEELEKAGANIPFGAAIVNADGTIVAVGGSKDVVIPEDYDVESSLAKDNIATVDMETGEVTVVGSLAAGRSNFHLGMGEPIQLAASGSTIYVGGGAQLSRGKLVTADLPAERLVRQDDGTYVAESLEGTLPSTHYFHDYSFGVAAGTDGAAFAALKVDEGDEDTYTVGNGANTSAALGKKAADVPLAYATALAYHGKLYVMGLDEFNGGLSVMRATSFSTPAHPAGELSKADPEPEPEPEPEPSPDSEPTPDGEDGDSKSRLPQTGDPIGAAIPVALVLASAALVSLSALLRKRNGDEG